MNGPHTGMMPFRHKYGVLLVLVWETTIFTGGLRIYSSVYKGVKSLRGGLFYFLCLLKKGVL